MFLVFSIGYHPSNPVRFGTLSAAILYVTKLMTDSTILSISIKDVNRQVVAAWMRHDNGEWAES